MSDTTSPFKSPEVAAKLLGNTGTRRVTDTTHETEKAVISTIAFSGAAHRWTWALFRPTRIGAELYAEIPQQAHPDYATDQAELAEIFALYPEIKYITSHPQMLSLWPSIECTFKRIQKAKGGTRLQLVSFTQRDHTREDEYSRDEQLLKLLGAKHMETDNLTDFFPRDENGQPVDDTPISDTPKPLLGRVHFEKDYFLVSGHIAKWLKLTDKADIGRATREAMGGKTWPEMWPKQDEEPTPEQMQAAADNIARMADEYVSRHLSGQSFEMTLATARNTAMVTFGNYNVDASKDNFKAATGYDNALQYMSQPGASVEVLKKAIANWCLAHNATMQNEAAKNAPTTNEKAPTGATTPEIPPTTNSAPDNAGYQASAQKLPPVQSKSSNGAKPMMFPVPHTLMGISIMDIAQHMNERFPDKAYEKITGGMMEGKTDLPFEYVRDRFDEKFGPHGYGWKVEPHATLGCVQYERNDKTHIVTMVCHVFKYRVVLPNGELAWEELSPMSDSDKNTDQGYAYRGAFTSLLKQILRSLGGMNHILMGEYDHNKARASQNRKPAA